MHRLIAAAGKPIVVVGVVVVVSRRTQAVVVVVVVVGLLLLLVVRVLLLSPPSSTPASTTSPRIVGRQSQPKDLRKGEKGLAVHKEIVLPESRLGRHGRLGVRHDLEDVVSLHRPRKVKDPVAVFGTVDLLPVRQDQSFSRGDTPNNCHVVFFSAAIRSGLSGRQGIEVGESESPTDPTLRTGDSFPACDGGKVDLIHVGLVALASSCSSSVALKHDRGLSLFGI
mmetsp:Transcript_116250/g.237765  ORF Transcript_116250/g.237765 Transcript_116250/m.237765 type:complete len:225 (-) Transcript_116250:317-991(-)